MHLYIYLPIAGINVNVLLLVGLGIIVGFISGLFGVGGGFLMTPLLIMMGIPPTVAAASDSNQIVATTSSGTYAHWRLGNVDMKMGLFLLVGGIWGGTTGVELIKIFRRMGNADFLIELCYVILLGIVGTYMLLESLGNLRMMPVHDHRTVKKEKMEWFGKLNHILPWKTHFVKSGVTMSAVLPVFTGFLVGTFAAIMGLGGGFVMVPAMVYLLRIPMHTVVGTNLFQEIFLCVNVTFLQAYINHTVDIVLVFILVVGSSLGAQFGAQVSNKLKADQLKIFLACIILLVMFDMLFDLQSTPDLLLSLKGGH